MNRLYAFLASLLLIITQANATSDVHYQYPFKKVVIWGHKLHSHTHSYIHWAFYRAFKHLGYDTYWLDQNDNIRNMDFHNTLFITEGQVDTGIPLRSDCRYILHNCTSTKYQHLRDQNLCITMQVYTHDCLPRAVKEIDDFIFVDHNDRCLYMPWGTDLLPHEIEPIKAKVRLGKRALRPNAYFIGTIGGGIFGNEPELQGFMRACREQGIQFVNKRFVDLPEHMDLIFHAALAPAIQGAWQVKQGYIPCRIFKNISYGHIGITNSETVYHLFKEKIVYHPDTYQLGLLARQRMNTITPEELCELMTVVQEKHTYINRITHLLWFLNEVKPIAGS